MDSSDIGKTRLATLDIDTEEESIYPSKIIEFTLWNMPHY